MFFEPFVIYVTGGPFRNLIPWESVQVKISGSSRSLQTTKARNGMTYDLPNFMTDRSMAADTKWFVPRRVL